MDKLSSDPRQVPRLDPVEAPEEARAVGFTGETRFEQKKRSVSHTRRSVPHSYVTSHENSHFP